uniref:ORF36 n=1 Tax=Oryctolagus cuniculus TaxID=9986 RepID=O19047_RABIT|nr:ORF36 [Oryctolagus cuniculus]
MFRKGLKVCRGGSECYFSWLAIASGPGHRASADATI